MPDNALYFQLAYGATVAIYGIYALLLLRRARRLDDAERRDVRP